MGDNSNKNTSQLLLIKNFKTLAFAVQKLENALKIAKVMTEFINQRTNGPVNAHLISGPSISIKDTKPGKYKVKK